MCNSRRLTSQVLQVPRFSSNTQKMQKKKYEPDSVFFFGVYEHPGLTAWNLENSLELRQPFFLEQGHGLS